MARHLTGASVFRDVVKEKISTDSESTNEGRLNLICPRAINKYVNEKNELEQLIKSIKEDGLMNPIIVNRIDDFLDKNSGNMSRREIEYYTARKEQGFKYFIVTGHRRFKAYCSLYLGNGAVVHTDEDLERFYEIFNARESQNEYESVDQLSNISPYVSIPFKIEENSYFEEASKYNKSNLEQRSIQAFEIVDNVYDEMRKLGCIQTELERWKNSKIDAINDSRTAKKLLDKANQRTKAENLTDLKFDLKELDPSFFPGYLNARNVIIMEYIEKEKHRKLGLTSVRLSMDVLETLPNCAIKDLYDGKITFKQAVAITSYLQKGKDTLEHLQECLEAGFDFEAYEKEVKTDKKRTVKYTSTQLVDFIKDLEKGRTSIEEIVAKLKECGMY